MEQASAVVAASSADSINLYAFALALAFMMLGAAIHWIKLRRSGRTKATLLEYIFTDNPTASAKAGGSIFAVAAMAAGTGVADWIDPVMLWTVITTTHSMPAISFFGIGAALSGGYMLDSGVNGTATQPSVDSAADGSKT